nr:probable leucine-rich repeat receptor-like protein kinase At1g35710 [Ipomoea trifida]
MQPSLIMLNLSACHLYSLPPTLPFLNFTSLQILDLSHNHFGSSIPSWLFNLSSLATLNLKNSEIQGSIPETFQTMTSLTVLDLSENNLRGELRSALPSLLKEVRFSGNRLNGSLAKNIMHLKHLVVLDVARNSLNDTLTQGSLNFSDLKELDLSYNSIVLKMNQSWIPSFQLDVIALRSCQLEQRFPSWLRTQKTIFSVDISDAGISDKVPDWFWDLSPAMEHMNLSWNQLSGQLPDLSRFSLSVVDLSGNNFQGPVPHFSSMMIVFILRTNSFSGTVSPVCESLVYNNSLRFLDLSSNNLSGLLPDCWVNGTELIVLNLGSNFLFGEIPQSLGNLLNLKMLLLNHNKFLGELPSSLQKLRRLTVFDVGSNNLTGSILIWIGEFYTELIILVLRGNQFSGAIPPQLCRLEYLTLLELSNNALTGTIPKCVNNFLIMAGVEGVPSFIFDQYTAYEKDAVKTIIVTISNPHCMNHNDPKIQHHSSDWLDGAASFFISMGAGFIPGFWAFWGSLLLSKSWRYAYFRFLDNTADNIYVFIAIKLRNWKERKQTEQADGSAHIYINNSPLLMCV